MKVLTGVLILFSSGVAAQNLVPDALSSSLAPRERISINEGWRFHLGDAADAADGLRYDVRPEIKESADGKAADAEPEEAGPVEGARDDLLKRWILPTGNAFIADSRRRYVRPPGHPGGGVSFVRADFDDRSWRSVDLPHTVACELYVLFYALWGSHPTHALPDRQLTS